MTTENIQSLQAKLEQRKAEARAKAQSQIENAKLALLDNEDYLNALERIETTSIKQEVINKAIKVCEEVIESVKVHNPATHQYRKWSGRSTYDFGADINLMYQLATGIRYSVAEHRELMLEATGLDPVVVDHFVDAMGSPSYYQPRTNEVVPSQPYNVASASAFANVMASQLGIAVDVSKLTESNFSTSFQRQAERANLLKKEADSVEDGMFTLN